MGEYKESELDAIFFGLSHPVRRRIVRQLAGGGESRVTEIAGSYRLSLNTISKHIRVLERSRLVSRRVRGRDHYIRLEAERLQSIERWLDYYRDFWTESLEGLARYFAERPKKEDPNG